MSANIAAVVFTAEELASLAQAALAFSSIINKIKIAAPDVWASVESDYAGALAAWNAPVPAPSASVAAIAAPGPAVTASPAADGAASYADASALVAGSHVEAPQAAPVSTLPPTFTQAAESVVTQVETSHAPVNEAPAASADVAHAVEPPAASADVATALATTAPSILAQVLAILTGKATAVPHDVAAVVNAPGVLQHTSTDSSGNA